MDVDDLAKTALQPRRIDAVRVGEYVAFMYKGDASYERLSASDKGFDIGGVQLPLWQAQPAKSPAEAISSWRDADGAANLLLAYMLRTFGDRLMVVDVGCQYGFSTMDLARKIMGWSYNGKVHAFDCGMSRNLAPLNFDNNGLGDRIQFHPVAVGAVDQWLAMHSRFNFTADNRVCNGGNPSDLLELSEPVRGVTLDRHLGSALGFPPLYAKIDTQGNEPRVFAGMNHWLATGETALCLEFSPEAYKTMMDPVKFTERLLETHHVFDIGQLGGDIIPVEHDGVEEMMARVHTYPYNWTDFVAFDRKLSFALELERRLVDASRKE